VTEAKNRIVFIGINDRLKHAGRWTLEYQDKEKAAKAAPGGTIVFKVLQGCKGSCAGIFGRFGPSLMQLMLHKPVEP
jgi:hypothetical protein